MPGDRELVTQLREHLAHLSAACARSFRVVASHGGMRRRLAVLRERYGNHEHAIRERKLSPGGVMVSEPLVSFSGTPPGNPRFEGAASTRLPRDR
jgi:hypothetical protein